MTSPASGQWPWRADSPLDIARRVAWSYREALQAGLPDRCRALDEIMIQERGQRWVAPTVHQHHDQDLLTAFEAAELCHVKVKTIYEWRRRGLKVTQTPDGARYRVADLLKYLGDQRRKRAGLAPLPDTGRH